MKCLICQKPVGVNKNTTKAYACPPHMTIAGTYGYWLGKDFYLSRRGKYLLQKLSKNKQTVV